MSAPTVAFCRLQGDVREHVAMLERAAPAPWYVDRGTGPRRRHRHARRRVDHDAQAGPRLRPVRAARGAAGRPAAFGTCAGMILLADRIEAAPRTRRRSAGSTSWCAATRSGARWTRSRPKTMITGFDAVPRAVHPRALGGEADQGTTSRSSPWRKVMGRIVAVRQAPARHVVPPRDHRRPPLPALSWSRWPTS